MEKVRKGTFVIIMSLLLFTQIFVGTVYAFDDFSVEEYRVEPELEKFMEEELAEEASFEDYTGVDDPLDETDEGFSGVLSEESAEPAPDAAEITESTEILEYVEEEIPEEAVIMEGDPNEISDDFACAEAAETSGSTITVDVTSGEDIGFKAAQALRIAGLQATDKNPYTVKIPAGKYKLGTTLHIYSNTILDCQGVTLTCTINESGNMLMSGTNGRWAGQDNYNESKIAGGYQGIRNVSVLGGTWIGNTKNSSVIFRMAHATNVTWKKCTIIGGGGTHQAEVCAMNGFYVTNCVFRDFVSSSSSYGEALQLDTPCSSITFMKYYLDGVPNKNVNITGCTFSNAPRGVGTHTVLRGSYSQNMNISNNIFKNIDKEAIVCLNFANSKVQNNQISNCGGGILFSNGLEKARYQFVTIFDGSKRYGGSILHNLNSVISGNKITVNDSAAMKKKGVAPNGITLYGAEFLKAEACHDNGTLPAENYYVSGVTIENNTITSSGYGMYIGNARNCSIKGNTLVSKNNTSAVYDGIRLCRETKELTLASNIIKYFPEHGIYVTKTGSYGAGSVGTISGNQISKCAGDGILLYNGASVTGKISNNIITGCSGHGICITKNSKAAGIISNTITSGKKYGICVGNKSKISSISNNEITGNTKHAIVISGIYQDLSITGNTLSVAGSYNTVHLNPATTNYTISFKKNIIKGNAKYYACYLKSGKYSISGNQISNVTRGFQIEKGVKGTVKDLQKISSKVAVKAYANGYSSPKISSVPTGKFSKVSNAAGKKLQLTWIKYSGITGVQVQYSQTADFSSEVVTKTAGSTSTGLTLSGLASGKKYYLRTRTYLSVGGVRFYGSYGAVTQIVVK